MHMAITTCNIEEQHQDPVVLNIVSLKSLLRGQAQAAYHQAKQIACQLHEVAHK